MHIATILLTREDKYVNAKGELPTRPAHDKPLLKALCKDGMVTAAGFDMLPPSIRKVVHRSSQGHYSVGVTIKEIDSCNLLIISRSDDIFVGGKKFRFDNFAPIVIDSMIEIWARV